MHEMGVVINMLQSLDKIAKQNNVDRIERVSIDLGEMTGVVPSYLKNCWPAATEGTVCHRSELLIRQVRGLAHCLDCGEDYLLMDNVINEVPTCPGCGGTRWQLREGDQLVITEIGVKEE